MAVWIDVSTIRKTHELLAGVLMLAYEGQRVQFVVAPSTGPAVVQRMRVALSRSREKNRMAGKSIREFTLRHEIYPFTLDGKRHDCIVMWIEKDDRHIHREILDDLVER